MARMIQATTLFLILLLLATVSAPTDTALADSADDRNALVALYNATDGSNWTNRANWLSDGPLDNWYGVTSDANGRVTGVNLNYNDLAGEIPVELGNLSNLLSLDLGSNQLTGPIPVELGNLSNLLSLDLGSNQLTGPIPVELGNLSNLEGLSLYHNQLTGPIPVELGNLSNLGYLDLVDNKLTGSIPAELGNLPNLKYLVLDSNKLTGSIPAELGNLSNLLSLDLVDNQLTGSIPAELGNLSNLERLSLSDNQLTGCIPLGLQDVAEHDLDQLGLDFCEAEVPGAPTGLTAEVSETAARVDLSWTMAAITGGVAITGYRIESSVDGNAPWMQVIMTTDADTSYTDDGTDNDGPMFEVGEWLHYRVAAINSAGTGPFSDPRYAGGDPLVARYDANGNNMIDKAEVIAAINDYLFGRGDEAISKAEVIRLINLYLFG